MTSHLTRLAVGASGDPDTEVGLYDEIINRFGSNDSPTLMGSVARARVGKGYVLSQLGRDQEALSEYDQVICAARDDRSDDEQLCRALHNKGHVLRRLGQLQDAVSAFRCAGTFATSDSAVVRRLAADSMITGGVTLLELGRPSDAFELFDEVANEFHADVDLDVRERSIRGRAFKAQALVKAGALVDAISVYADIENLTSASYDPRFRQHRAQAVYGAAASLERIGQPDDAEALYRRLIDEFNDAETPEIAEAITFAKARLSHIAR
jgi:tetratricopeptide (TPR) repeat protein